MTLSQKFYLTKRENGYYYIGWYDNGHRRWKSTKCTTKSDALQYLRDYKVNHKETDTVLTLSALMERFTTLKGNSIRPNTLALYKVAVERFIATCGDKVLDAYTVSDVETFKNLLLAQGHKGLLGTYRLRVGQSITTDGKTFYIYQNNKLFLNIYPSTQRHVFVGKDEDGDYYAFRFEGRRVLVLKRKDNS